MIKKIHMRKILQAVEEMHNSEDMTYKISQNKRVENFNEKIFIEHDYCTEDDEDIEWSDSDHEYIIDYDNEIELVGGKREIPKPARSDCNIENKFKKDDPISNNNNYNKSIFSYFKNYK